MRFRIVSPVFEAETIATGRSLREIRRLCRAYGGRAWKKRKGVALVELADGQPTLAEVHWYECHGVGRREWKIKRLIE